MQVYFSLLFFVYSVKPEVMVEKLKNIRFILEKIKQDHRSGSGSLQQEFIDKLLTYLIDANDFTAEEVKSLRQELSSFRKEMKDFAIISHFTNDMMTHLPAGTGLSSADLYDSILSYKKKWNDVQVRTIGKFLKKVSLEGSQVVLHSQSSVVRELFRYLSNKHQDISIIQTESRPMLEGREQAKYLATLGYRVKIVTDVGFSPLLGVTDMVILGADRIYPDVFINKCGSHALTVLSRRQDIPVYVLADSRKFVTAPGEYNPLTEEEKPFSEVWNNPPHNIFPVNYYFEPVPTRLVNAFFTESHIIPGKEMPFSTFKE